MKTMDSNSSRLFLIPIDWLIVGVKEGDCGGIFFEDEESIWLEIIFIIRPTPPPIPAELNNTNNEDLHLLVGTSGGDRY